MERTGGSNKHSHEHSSHLNSGPGKRYVQNHTNDLGWKSADSLCIPNPEGSRKIMKTYHEEGGEGSEGEANKKGHQHRLPTSVSASPYLGGTQLSAGVVSPQYSSIPSNNEMQPSIPEGYSSCSSTTGEQWHHQGSCTKNADGKNVSPTHITVSTLMENGDNQLSLRHNYTPSPRSSPRIMNAQASGESSDERGERLDRSKLSTSREGSFERSVSFQEGILDQDKSNEAIRTSDSNRSLDSSRPLDSISLHSHTSSGKERERDRKESREGKSSEKDKKSKKSWYSMLSPTYKSRSEELKRLFKDLSPDERLIVDYSCALQKDILVHGRLYVTRNYLSFYSKIFGWETFLSIKCKDIVAMTKEKTALVIPNALQVNTETDKHFFTSFAARDKAYLMLFRIWQNALMDQQMSTAELWHWVRSSYGEELGLTSDDDDYVAPSTEDDMKSSCCSSTAHLDPSSNAVARKVAERHSVDSTEDASQGESNVEEGHHSLKLTSHNDTRIDGSKSPSRDSTKSSSALSMNTPPPYQHCPSGDKENHDLPTDFSDTVESDPEKEKLPGSLAETIVCPNISSHHMGRDVSNTVYGLPIDTLFTLLFTNSKFMLDLHTARKTYDVVSSPWQSNPETNQKIRQVTYTLTLPTNSFGPKVSHVTETQVISSFSKSSEIYTIDAEASNSGIPYADSFYVSNHWCLTRESANETRLAVWSQVKYKKNVWGFMKNVIDKNAFSGMEGLISDLNVSLLLEVDKTNLRRTKRRRRRAGSKSSEIVDPLLQLPSPGVKSNDSHKSTQIPSRKMTLPSVSMETDSPPVKSSVKSAALIFLCVLLAVNAFLYYRLYDLEERVVSNVSFKSIGLDSSIFKFSGSQGDDGLAEEWVQILHQQESLHAEELERWRKAVMEAADYLRKAEESLRNLHASIPSEQASKMQSLLQQLQLLQQMQEQKTAATTHKTQLSPEQGETTLEKELLPHEKIEL